MEKLCRSPFWDDDITFNSKYPDLTPCFESTVLAWIPCSFLWFLASYEIYHALTSNGRSIHNSFVNIAQRALTLLLVILHLVEFCCMIGANEKSRIYKAQRIAPGIKFITFILVLILYCINKQKGIRSSGVMFIFWMLMVLCGVFEFQTVIRHFSDFQRNIYLEFRYITVFIAYPVAVLQFLIGFFSDPGISYDNEGTDETMYDAKKSHAILHVPCPEIVASFPSRMTFHWATLMAWRGYKKPLEIIDLWDLSIENTSRVAISRFNKYWMPALEKSRELNTKRPIDELNPQADTGSKNRKKKSRKRQASILPSIFKANFCAFVFGGVTRFTYDSLGFLSPYFLRLLIEHKSSNEHDWIGYFYAVILFVVAMTQTIVLSQHYHKMFVAGMRIRSALAAAIYRKSLIMSHAARKESTVGEIVNLMSVDTQKIVDFSVYVHLMWSAPIQIVVALYLSWTVLGSSVFAGMSIIAVFVPVNIFISDKVKDLQTKRMEFKDQRVKLMNEVLSGIKVLKLYAWEPSFECDLREIRNKEIVLLRMTAYLNAFSVFLWHTAPMMMAVITFTTYALSDSRNVLDAKKVFVSLALFNLMRNPMSLLPNAVVMLIEGYVSMKRLNKILNSEEIDPQAVCHQDNAENVSVEIDNASFSWDDGAPILRDISFAAQPGTLIAVVGFVGSGKSSMLSAMLGEMQKISGTVCINGSVSYVAQQPWIQNTSVRENILFGKTYEVGRYRQIIEACSLVPDLSVLSGGDKTEIGEKGINLSGGQKSRISLARAVYHDADVYLLDDPLSAVDAHVAKDIFEKVIGPEGLLKTKTRIIVTHGITFLPQMTKIVVMADGKISDVGTYEELIGSKSNFAEFLNHHSQLESKRHESNDRNESAVALRVRTSIRKQEGKESFLTLQVSRASWIARTLGHSITTVDKLIEEEKVETGTVKKDCYIYYAASVGWWMTFSAFSFYTLYSGLAVSGNIWLAHWASTAPSATGRQDANKRDVFLMVYGTLGIGQALAFFVANLCIFLGCLQASKYLHDQVLWNVLRCPMSFFDTNPLGRIVNRFSRDVDVIDSSFPTNLRSWMTCFFHVISTLVVISYSTPWFLVVVAPIAVLYIAVERFYVATSRQLKRIDSISRSPIYSHFTETLTGTVTIRAFKKQQQFIAAAERIVDYNQIAYYASLVANRWLAVRLETSGNLIILFSAILAAVPSTSVGSVGLSVTYALNITLTLNWLVRMTSDVESNVVAVERIKEYNEVPQEAAWEIPESKPRDSWPAKGRIVFENFETRYRPGQNLVVKNLSCSIEPGEKVGIVGRTGAGKSSLTMSIFRIIEATGGRIVIDDVDISEIGLHDIRGRITIIPQDPVLFSGTLRFNIDPFRKYSDHELWHAIECAHLKQLLQGLPDGLEHAINEGGDNLSVGQRQLICLARALLRKTKILIMDEATASLDLDTDDLIQTTVRSEFQDCTVLTIAHRINTIMDYNRVIVLDNGEIVEYNTPEVLLRNGYIFSKMVQDAGL